MNSMDEYVIPGTMPILALRGLAVFPKQTIHFEVGRLKSMKAVEQAMKADHMILLLLWRWPTVPATASISRTQYLS